MQLLTLANYLWAIKTVSGASHYGWSSSIIILVACFEVSMLLNTGFEFVDGVYICLALVSFTSQTSYNQTHLAYSYVACIAYTFVRSFFH